MPFDVQLSETAGRLTIEPMGTVVKSESIPVVFRHTSIKADKVAYGLEFGDIAPNEYYVLADLMYADSEALPKFLMGRRKHKNLFAGTGRFMWWGLVEPIRAIGYAIARKGSVAEQPVAEAKPAEPPTVWLRRLISIANGGPQPVPGASSVDSSSKVA